LIVTEEDILVRAHGCQYRSSFSSRAPFCRDRGRLGRIGREARM